MNTHIDDFIDKGLSKKNEAYARWMFNHFRLPANLKYDFNEFMEKHKLFCKFEGEVYRVTGASRIGDVWLTQDFTQDTGYQKRVSVDHCTEWSDKISTSVGITK